MESHQGRKGQSDHEENTTAASPEEEEWLLATQDVVPLKDRAEEGEGDEPSPTGGLADRLKSKREPVATVGDGSLPALDRRTAERLRRGQMEIDASLDLHGLTQDEAFLAIQTFLYESLQEGRRCVLLVTGKGTARDGGGVLRSAVPRWLTEGAYAPHLIGISPAHAQHGGEGALYVLLRRARG